LAEDTETFVEPITPILYFTVLEAAVAVVAEPETRTLLAKLLAVTGLLVLMVD
jgi:hypothetical protein